MKSSTARLTVIAALAAASTQALAADWGGIRNYSANPGTLVPAPAPVPEYKPSWYFRLDAGLGVVSDPDVSGSISGLDGAPGDLTGPDSVPLASSLSPSWFETDFDTFLTLGGGVGYYFGGGWRMDATLEKRSNDDVTGFGITDFDDTFTGPSGSYVDSDGVDGTGPQTRFLITDSAKIDGTFWMLNLYYDLWQGRSFTPYVGAGVGFSWNQVSRRQTVERQDCAAGPPCAAPGDFVSAGSVTETNEGDTVSFAAAAMAGFSYQVSDITSIDIGYRYLFIGSDSTSMSVGAADSTLEIGDQHVHQVRAGLRFDVE
ncbi:MAG: outer membrane protein [Hyphomicrobium sp.]